MSWNIDYEFPSSNVTSSWTDAMANFFNTEVDFAGLGPLHPSNNNITEIQNFMTAATTLTQWWDLNRLGNYSGPGTSQDNPYEVPFNATQKAHIIASLGSNASPAALWTQYFDVTKYNSAVGNTYFNLNTDERYGGVEFKDNKLVIYDVYNFEGIGDWGTAPTAPGAEAIKRPDFLPWLVKTFAVIIVMGTAGTITAGIRQLFVALGFNPNTGKFADGTDVDQIRDTLPYYLYTRDRLNIEIGNVANLYIRNEFTADEVCQYNPALYRDAVSKGYLKSDATASGSCSNIGASAQCFDAADNVVPVGQAQPAPILGLPYYQPSVRSISDYPSQWQVGTNDKYPSPFTSFSQQITNNTFFLGPYAMWGPISGRICLIVGGVNSGERGFIAQCWDDFDDGPYNKDNDGIQYSSKKEWWDNCRTIDVVVPNLLFSGQPQTLVTVAVQSFQGPGASNVWGPNWPIWESPFGTVNLSLLIPLVAITSRYF